MQILKKNFFSILVIICLVVLFAAFFIEYFLGHQPCNLCLIERIPYALTILIVLLIYKFKAYEKKALFFISFLFLFSTLISLYHFGLESEFFDESVLCNLNVKEKVISKEDLLNQLKEMPVSCKNVTFKLFGLSLTTYNILLSLIIFLISIKKYKEKKHGKNRQK